MNKKAVISLLASVSLFAMVSGCAEKEAKKDNPREKLTLESSLAVDGNPAAWIDGEKVSICNGSAGGVTTLVPAGSGKWTGSVVASNMYYAVYPLSRIVRWMDDATFRTECPSLQVASAPGLAPEAAVFTARTPSDEKKLDFRPVFAMVRFAVESTSPLVSSVEISSVSGKELSGRCEFKLSGFAPVTPVSVTGGSPKVTLRSFDGECPLEEGVYYIALIPGEYPAGDLQIKLNYTNGSSNTGALAFSGKIAVGEAFDYGTLAPTEESGSGTIDTTPKPQIEDKYDIYLLIGQSNMAGRGYLTDADKTEKVENVFLLGSDEKPVVATHPFNQYSSIRKDLSVQQMNPGYGFALTIRDKTGGRPVLLVCNARGGTTIQEWAVGKSYYNEAVRRTLEAMKYGRLKGILWHQGCGNSGAVTKGEIDYLALLKAIVDQLRTDLKCPDVPFVAGELPYWRSTSPKFNEMIRTISTKITHSDWVSAEGCTMRADSSDPHFSRDGQILLGQRYGQKIIQMVYSKN